MSLLDLLMCYQEEVPPRMRIRDFVAMILVLAAFVVLVIATGYWMGVLPR